MSATPAATLSALRQLACLGLPGKSILPEAFGLLRSLVGFEAQVVLHLDDRYRVIDASIPPNHTLAMLNDYAENFHCRTNGDGVTGMTVAQAQESGLKLVHVGRLVERKDLVETDFWNRILRPIDFGWLCQMPLRDGRRPLATVILARPFTLRDYSAAETGLFEKAQPWFCHALSRVVEPRPEPAGPLFPAGDSGALVIDVSGKILSASEGAIALLHRAVGAPLDAGGLRRALQGDTRILLRRYAQAVGMALVGRHTPPPCGTICSEHGVFRLRAHALDAFAPGQAMQVSLHIERQVPQSLQLFRSPRFLALAARERDICLGLLAGHSYADMARQLGLKASSVVDYAKSLYRRLDIDGRKDLQRALFSDAPA